MIYMSPASFAAPLSTLSHTSSPPPLARAGPAGLLLLLPPPPPQLSPPEVFCAAALFASAAACASAAPAAALLASLVALRARSFSLATDFRSFSSFSRPFSNCACAFLSTFGAFPWTT